MYSGMPQVLCEECCKHRFVASHPGIVLRDRPQTICLSEYTFAPPVQIVVKFLFNKQNYEELAKNIMKKIATSQCAGSKMCAFAHFSV